jgi:acyl-CoA synthetase (AMP-forming)/AMP-acid ligase II
MNWLASTPPDAQRRANAPDDTGSPDGSGNLTLSGRASEVIITVGVNVCPAEIENVLARAPGEGAG